MRQAAAEIAPTGSQDVAVHAAFVPIAYSSGFFDTYVLPERRYRLPAISRVGPGLGAMALGIARGAIETLKEIASTKTPERTGEAAMAARALARLATSHAVNSAVQAVDLMYVAGGASSLYVECPLERAFRDVHAITQHIGVHPRVMQSTGRVLFGLESDNPLL
jgi:indole-3-acetate monooxygenase